MTTTQAHTDRMVDRGVVGPRRLVGVQTFDVARLTTHAVSLIPGTFVAVSGRGPKGDSNGSGKTTFLIAVSLLLADPQWRLTSNGGRWAAGILFKPDAAGIDATQQFPAASYGYVVGVFAVEPGHPAQNGQVRDPLTVWVRIAPTAPYVEARWAPGLRVVSHSSQVDRYAQADLIWSSLPTANRASARRMAELLYGATPRCLSYLDTPLRPAAPSLLSQQLTEMTPEQIGESLIALAGLTDPLEREEKQRGELADQQRRLRQAEDDDHRIRQEEDADLAGVAARQQAREHLSSGEHLWRLHFAKGYLEVLDQHAEAQQRLQDAKQDADELAARAAEARERLQALRAQTDLEEAAQQARGIWEEAQERLEAHRVERGRVADRLSRLAGERASLLAKREGWSGASVEQAEATARAAQANEVEATAAWQTTSDLRDAAREELRRVRTGRDGTAGQVLDRLEEAGISGVAMLDVVELDSSARHAWEPRLWPHRHAVIVAPTDERAALEALAALPGVEVVVSDAPAGDSLAGLPAGVRCSVPLGRFLGELAERHPHLPDPDRAADPGLGGAILGGFTEQIAGRTARLARAEARVAAAEQAVQAAEQARGLQRLRVEAAAADLRAALAATALLTLEQEAQSLSTQVATLDGSTPALVAAEKHARAEWMDAHATAHNHDKVIEAADARARLLSDRAGQERERERRTRQARDDLRLPYWRAGWSSSEEAARALVAAEPTHVQGLRPDTMRRRAAEALRDALHAYGITKAEDAPEDLAEVFRRREQFAEGSGGVAGDSVDFLTLARPLRTRLDGHRDTDQIIAQRVAAQRHLRETALGELRTEVGGRAGMLEHLQDMIERLVEQNLNQVGAAFDRLDRARGGYGATLKLTSQRPDSPTSHWRWLAVPCWRRSPSGGMVAYREIANGAQVKVHAIQLVLAALLANGDAAGRVLVLDELGNSLGEVNKRDVLSSLKQVAAEQQVTILGTCQDATLVAAAQVCGEVLWFTHASDVDAYNQPTRVWAFDPDGERVELTADWVRSGRNHV